MPTLRNVNGVWWIWQQIRGRQVRRTTGYPVRDKQTKAAAERRATEIELSIRAESHGWEAPPAPTVWAWWTTTYQPTYSSRKRHPERDRSIMGHVEGSFLASMPLNEVQKSDCDRYLNERRQAFAANPHRKHPTRICEDTVQRERSFLHALFQQAVESDVIAKNPWHKVERKDYTARNRVVTPEQQQIMLSRVSPRFQRFILFLLGTGVRLNEARGINPDRDLHLDNRFVTVTGKFGKTRDVPLPVALVPVLRQQLEEDGRLWRQNPQRLREIVGQSCLGTPELPHFSPHDLRHTFGHRWLADGGDIFKLSKILGHESVGVTEKHYAYLLKENLRDAMDARNLGLEPPAEKSA